MATAIITGASSKIGQNIAIALSKNGYDIIVHKYSSNKNINIIKKEIKKYNYKCKIISADFRCNIQRQEFINKIKKITSNVDILINNVAIFKEKKFENISIKLYQEIFDINVKTPFFLSQGLVPLLRLGKNPLIINITDSMINKPLIKYSHYFSSKGALNSMTKALSNELAPHIRVNAIALGIIHFPKKYNNIKKINIFKKIPLNRLGDVSEIAKMIIFLAHNALYVTGQIINIDGGISNK